MSMRATKILSDGKGRGVNGAARLARGQREGGMVGRGRGRGEGGKGIIKRRIIYQKHSARPPPLKPLSLFLQDFFQLATFMTHALSFTRMKLLVRSLDQFILFLLFASCSFSTLFCLSFFSFRFFHFTYQSTLLSYYLTSNYPSNNSRLDWTIFSLASNCFVII
jgi:hypothetical protein